MSYTNISGAALEQASKLLANPLPSWVETDHVVTSEQRTFAFYIQQVSDVAKRVFNRFSDGSQCDARVSDLQSLILPDEPCKHPTVCRYPPAEAFTCTECGAVLDLVEVGRDD